MQGGNGEAQTNSYQGNMNVWEKPWEGKMSLKCGTKNEKRKALRQIGASSEPMVEKSTFQPLG